jgi:hypothetical protein
MAGQVFRPTLSLADQASRNASPNFTLSGRFEQDGVGSHDRTFAHSQDTFFAKHLGAGSQDDIIF